MADAFDSFLATALAPAERPADREFVSSVHARIMLEDRLDAERSALVGGLVTQLVALLAVAAAVLVIGRSAAIEDFFARTPALGLAILIAAFGLLVGLLTRAPSQDSGAVSQH